ncbi:dimethyladenosine transferase 2, mitochondrial [Pelobates fuscus]|uniref:dimethyladenosine transferase 2, mitochondrial n=1 Tax=Pelobates fuscus TaxID=191477 RepID=UPI002FE42EFE
MSSLSGARLGLCVLRSGPQAGASLFCCYRQCSKMKRLALIPKCIVHNLCSRGMSAIAGQKQRDSWEIDLMDLSNELKLANSSRQFRRFITDPGLAKTVLKCLQPWESGAKEPLVMEFNPGPGVVTQTLLDAGVKVVALESQTAFLPPLEQLHNNTDGQLRVVHCDFFKLDPLGEGSMQPPVMYSETLFKQLGISKVPWSSDVPLKVFGIFFQKIESKFLWKHIYSIYEKRSIYRYGRIELNLFMSEKLYKKLTCPPGDMRNYQALGVLCQAAYDIQLLHMEPWSSFFTPSKFRETFGGKSVTTPNDHMCLVRLTPRKNLFGKQFKVLNSTTFILMVRQLLCKRKGKLLDWLNSWDPGNGQALMKELDIPENITTGNVNPDQYKRLFEAMEQSDTLGKSWIFNEVLENTNSL